MRNLFLIKRKKMEFFILTLIFFIISIFVSQRSEDMPDYANYKMLYDSPADIEFSYKFISDVTRWLGGGDGFYILLFIYAFLGLAVKNLFLYLKFSRYYYFLYIFGYFLIFFPIWDLIQIRYSVGIAFLILGFFSFKNKFLFLFIGCLFHYSIVIPAIVYLFFHYVRVGFFRLIISPILLLLFYFFTIGGMYGDKYNVNNYGEVYNIITTNSVFSLLLIIFMCFFRSGVNVKYLKMVESVILTSVFLLVFLSLISFELPSASFRLLFLVNYLLFVCLFFVRARNSEYILTLVTLFFVINYVYQIFFSVHKTF